MDATVGSVLLVEGDWRIERIAESWEKHAEENQKVNITTVLFDDKVDVIHDRFSIDIIKPLTEEDYYVRGCTALLDAVGSTISKVSNIQRHLPEDHRAGKVIFVITTDGYENSSREYSYDQIKKMIEQKKEEGWEFLFLGANIDAGREAEKIGISRNRSVTYENDAAGVGVNFATVGKALRQAVVSDCADELIADDWQDDIVKYRKEKKKRRAGI